MFEPTAGPSVMDLYAIVSDIRKRLAAVTEDVRLLNEQMKELTKEP